MDCLDKAPLNEGSDDTDCLKKESNKDDSLKKDSLNNKNFVGKCSTLSYFLLFLLLFLRREYEEV